MHHVHLESSHLDLCLLITGPPSQHKVTRVAHAEKKVSMRLTEKWNEHKYAAFLSIFVNFSHFEYLIAAGTCCWYQSTLREGSQGLVNRSTPKWGLLRYGSPISRKSRRCRSYRPSSVCTCSFEFGWSCPRLLVLTCLSSGKWHYSWSLLPRIELHSSWGSPLSPPRKQIGNCPQDVVPGSMLF